MYYEGNVVNNMFGGLKFTLYSLCVADTTDFLEPEIITLASGGLVTTEEFRSAVLLRRSILMQIHQDLAVAD